MIGGMKKMMMTPDAVSRLARTPQGRGHLGEALLVIMAALLLPHEDYRLMENVILPTEDGG